MRRPARNLDFYLAWQLVRRNVLYQRQAWVAVVTALVEPVIYYAASVLGLARLLDRTDPVSYALFAGPALVAICAMNGAVVECTNNVFFSWRQRKLYDSILCTELSPGDIAFGSLIFGTLRGWLYGTVFLMLLFGVAPMRAVSFLLVFTAIFFVAWMFAAIGLIIVTVIRTLRQLQYVHLMFFIMLLSANTFVNISERGLAARVFEALLPLSYASDLLRACSRDDLTAAVEPIGIIVLIAVGGSVLAIRRLSHKLVE